MADEIPGVAAELGSKAALDLSLTAGVFGGCSISLKIDNIWLAGAVSLGALSLGAFYLACKGPSENSIRKALERRILGVVDPSVTKISDGHSILVELFCRTAQSFLLFVEDLESNAVKFKLEEEFRKIGFKDNLEVIIRNRDEVYGTVERIRAQVSTPSIDREMSGAKRDGSKQESWEQKYKEMIKLINEMYNRHAHVSSLMDKQTMMSDEEPFYATKRRLEELDSYLIEFIGTDKYAIDLSAGNQGLEHLVSELNNTKETLKRETAISKGLRSTIRKLQEENAKMREEIKQKQVDKSWNRKETETLMAENMQLKDQLNAKEEQHRKVETEVRELREEAHVLEKENEIFQQKLKAKEKELERVQSEETDIDIPQSRSRASSASSGYQSGEEPDEPVLEITEMPRSQAVQEGKTMILSCRTRGLTDIRYRWMKDDVEISGANRPDLILDPVSMRDFGRYVCLLRDKNGSVIKTSDAADIDVFPSPKMRFRGLHELDSNTKETTADLLNRKRPDGQPTWRHVSRRYGLKGVSSAEALLDRLECWAPNLTVYYFCKTLKESADLKRLENSLLKSMVLATE